MKIKDTEGIRQKELDTILRSSALINSSLKIEDVLNYTMQWAEEFMDAEASTVYELDQDNGLLFIRMARGEKKAPVSRIKLKPGEGVAGRVVQTGKPMVIQDTSKERFFSNQFDMQTGFYTRSMICVPLLLRGKPVGALQVINKKFGELFTDFDLELLTSMSQQIAVALDNAKFYSRLEEKFVLTAQELKTTQKKLIRSERLAAMGHLVQGVAHEIRNPVTTIGGFALRIKRLYKEEPKVQKYIDIILSESDRLDKLVKEVHEFSDIQTPFLKPGDMKIALDKVIKKTEEQARKQDVHLVIRIAETLPIITMDADQLFTAFYNIVKNALESMPNGGELIFEAKYEDENILISISDCGCGIGREDLDSVYDPFVTSKTRGGGLGLTMVHQIIMNHDGEITMQSKKGVGTTVTLSLPVK